jgi:hypothetical protein
LDKEIGTVGANHTAKVMDRLGSTDVLDIEGWILRMVREKGHSKEDSDADQNDTQDFAADTVLA